MSNKLSIQQEKFCLKYSECGNASEAYRHAYARSLKWKDKTVWEKSSRLLSDGKVQARISELKADLAKESRLTKVAKLSMLEEMIKVKVSDYFTDQGEFKGFSALSEAEQICLKSYSKTPTKFGYKEVVILHDRLELIKIHNGMIGDDAPQRIDFGSSTPMFNISINNAVPPLASSEDEVDS